MRIMLRNLFVHPNPAYALKYVVQRLKQMLNWQKYWLELEFTK